jgi:hypothetical protein
LDHGVDSRCGRGAAAVLDAAGPGSVRGFAAMEDNSGFS